MNMIEKLISPNELEDLIYVPLPERNVCRLGKIRRTQKEFMLSLELGGFKMKDVMMDLGRRCEHSSKEDMGDDGETKVGLVMNTT